MKDYFQFPQWVVDKINQQAKPKQMPALLHAKPPEPKMDIAVGMRAIAVVEKSQEANILPKRKPGRPKKSVSR